MNLHICTEEKETLLQSKESDYVLVQNELATEKESIKSLSSSVTEYKSNLERTQQLLKEAEDKNKQLTIEIEKVRTEFVNCKNCDNHKSQISKCESEISEKDAKIKQLEASQLSLKSISDNLTKTLTDKINQKQVEYEALAKEKATLESQFEETKVELSHSKTKLEEIPILENKISHLTKTHGEFENKLTDANSEIQSLNAELESLRSQATSTEVSETVVLETEQVVEATPPPPQEIYINEETDLQKYVESMFKHYEVDLDVVVEQNSNPLFKTLIVGTKKFNSKVNNGKFYVKGGGGWYTLQDYIETFIVRKSGSRKSAKKVLTRTSGDLDAKIEVVGNQSNYLDKGMIIYPDGKSPKGGNILNLFSSSHN